MTNDNQAAVVDTIVDPKCELERSAGSKTAWVFKVRGHRIGNSVKDEVLAVQFGTPEIANNFASVHKECCDIMKIRKSSTPLKGSNSSPSTPGGSNTKATKTKRRLTINGVHQTVIDLDAIIN